MTIYLIVFNIVYFEVAEVYDERRHHFNSKIKKFKISLIKFPFMKHHKIQYFHSILKKHITRQFHRINLTDKLKQQYFKQNTPFIIYAGIYFTITLSLKNHNITNFLTVSLTSQIWEAFNKFTTKQISILDKLCV